MLQDQTFCIELSLFNEDHHLIGRAYKNVTVNEINWLNEIDDTMSIELVDEKDQNNVKLKISPIILSQHSSKMQNMDIITLPTQTMDSMHLKIK